MARPNAFRDFRIVNLEEQPQLTCHWILDFCNLISWATNLNELLLLHGRLATCLLICLKLLLIDGSVFGLSSCSPRQVRLMLLALCVS